MVSIILIILALILICLISTISMVWVGHIPKEYHYNEKLPKAMTAMSWTNMNSSVVQKGVKKSIISETEKLESCEAPEGFLVTTDIVETDKGNIKLYCIQPRKLEKEKDVPAMLYLHGGAFYYPLSQQGLYSMAYYAKVLNARVFLPDYHSSMFEPYPTPMMDCYYAALYIKKNARKLGISDEKFLLYGDSAGGCLAAGVTQYIRDFGGPEFCGQLLVYPVTDNSTEYESMKKYRDAAWSANANQNMWDIYLKNEDQGQLKYAAPNQSDDFSNLPPAYVEVAEMDILCDQGISYAEKLKAAGNLVEVYVVPGGYHGFDADQSNEYVKEIMERRVSFMKKMAGVR